MAKVHIADDDPDIRQLLTFVLAEEGHEVSISKNGRLAIEAMLADPPEVLILDLMMPEMDGHAVLKDMKNYEALAATKVLVLTAKGSEQDRHLAFDVRADSYLTKPFEPDEVVEGIEAMLDSSKGELTAKREQELETARLLSQLESILDE